MDFRRQFDLMDSLEWVFSAALNYMVVVLSKCSAPADDCFDNYKYSIKILRDFGKSRNKIPATDICERKDDMREWWTTRHPTSPDKWKPVLVLQFHFHVVMHFLRMCHSQLEPTDKLHEYINKFDLQRLDKIETNFLGYVSDIEKTADYRAEIGNTHVWLMDYALEYARLVSARPSHTDTGLHALLSELSIV